MIIVGEKINTSRTRIAAAVENQDSHFIGQIAIQQAQAGAHFIDVNAGTFLERESECLRWLVETVQNAVDLPLCLDSPSPQALTEAMKVHRGEPMINSISLETERLEALLPVVAGQPCHIVALCMAQTSMPSTVAERVEVGSQLIKHLTERGVPLERIYVDPLIQPVSVDTQMGGAALGAIQRIMAEFPGVNTICGLSNISFGLPVRRLINRNFLVLCMAHGLSAAILDPTDKQLMAALLSADMLLGNDEYCEKYIEAYQQGLITDR
ncbi:methyltetrahydrofolate cobalamin methyltransferase [Desulfoferrobacter suflitae]|uniref:methyltetrahydrofolate cobalamin methyltransferase n=1 Tax=Desulfoferrobacter suflitae TaxID=2865782 RepID=UPI0021647AC7|nr:methyltetrahydrofolate cobalamin methyltransferase [Desulfoferrobacter suflitae]MCK8600993.1 methyltetrahydrofolate cobalamin methyltransferase [Desulfoferrobacter suflitae]